MDRAKAEHIFERLRADGIGGWSLIRFIDNGKSAAVYEAERAGERAAIKVFDTELVAKYGDDSLLERLTREGALVGHDHPNLVKMLDHGADDTTGLRYLVMELLTGRSLASRLQEVPDSAIQSLIEQLAGAAEYLEGRNLAHRDIKPANIIVSDDFATLTLLDLGVLKPIGESSLTDPGSHRLFVGTNQYASPEFALRKEEDTTEGWRAVTFYQIGAVLHDLIMRRPLFAEHLGVPGLLAEAIQREVPVLSSDAVAPHLLRLARHCLVKSPQTRLELVSWHDFRPPEPETTRAAELARLIRDRVAAVSVQQAEECRYGAHTSDREPILMHQALNLVKDVLSELGRSDPPLPRRLVYRVAEANEVRCRFEPAEDLALPNGLSIRICVEVSDLDSSIIKLSAATAASLDFVEDEHAFELVFHDACDRALIDEALLVFILTKVDQVQRRES